MARRRAGVEIEGMAELIRQFKRIQRGTDDVKAILYPAAQEIQKAIQQKATRLDDGTHTGENALYGTLAENIRLEWDEATQTSKITTGDAYWAIFLEYGTVKMRAKPFMYDTMRRKEREALLMIEAEIKRRLGL